MTLALIVGGVVCVVLAAGLFIYVRTSGSRLDEMDREKDFERAMSATQPSSRRPDLPQDSELMSPRQPPPHYGAHPRGHHHSNQPRFDSDSIDYNDPMLDVLTPRSDIVTVDPSSRMTQPSVEYGAYPPHHGLGGSNGSGARYRMAPKSHNEFHDSLASYSEIESTPSGMFYARTSGENDVFGLDDVDELHDSDSESVARGTNLSSISDLHDSSASPNAWSQMNRPQIPAWQRQAMESHTSSMLSYDDDDAHDIDDMGMNSFQLDSPGSERASDRSYASGHDGGLGYGDYKISNVSSNAYDHGGLDPTGAPERFDSEVFSDYSQDHGRRRSSGATVDSYAPAAGNHKRFAFDSDSDDDDDDGSFELR